MEKITTHEVYKGVSAVFSCILVDESEVPIDTADIDTLTVTLYSLDDRDFPVINNREAVDAKDVNGGVLGPAAGAFSFRFTPEDNVILDETLAQERHMMRIDFTYDNGDGVGVAFQKIVVVNTEAFTNVP